MELWQDIFVGRGPEMQALRACWEKAKTGNPSVAAIIGESGFGKTRLAQEFFTWLSTHEDTADPAGYWPDRLGAHQDNLRVNPEKVGSAAASGTMPFLWWGLRLADPGKRNQQFGTALRDGKLVLAKHLSLYQLMEKRTLLETKRKKARWKLAKDIGVDVGGGLLTGGLLGPMVAVSDYVSETSAIEAEIADAAAGRVRSSEGDLVEAIVSELRRVCTARDGLSPATPAVLLFDDAQWISSDPMTKDLLEDCLAAAIVEDWPLLVILTCWEREWAGEHPSGVDGVHHIVRMNGIDPVTVAAERLDLRNMAQLAFPGVTEVQRVQIVAKADGNPTHLNFLISLFKEQEGLFERRDPSGPLSKEGEELLESTELEDIVSARFRQSPREVQMALAAASLQGPVFSTKLTLKTCRNAGAPLGTPTLYAADTPYAFVRLSGTMEGEFRQRSIWKMAQRRGNDLFGKTELDTAFRAALADNDEETVELSDTIIAQDIGSDDPYRRNAAMNALASIAARARTHNEHKNALAAANQWLDEATARGTSQIYNGGLDSMVMILSSTPRKQELQDLLTRYYQIMKRDCLPDDQGGSRQVPSARLDVLLNVCSALARSELAIERDIAVDASATYEFVAEQMWRTPELPEWQRVASRRSMRIALQRQSDLVSDPAERLPLILRQVEIAQELAPNQNPVDATSDLSNTYGRLTDTYFALGRIDEAKTVALDRLGILRNLLETHPDHQSLYNFAYHVSAFLLRYAKPPYSDADIHLAMEGLHGSIRSFNLNAFNLSISDVILKLAVIAKDQARRSSDFRAFLKRAENMVVAWIANDALRDDPDERHRILPLLSLVYQTAFLFREDGKVLRLAPQYAELSGTLFAKEMTSFRCVGIVSAYAKASLASLRRLRLVSAWKFFKQNMQVSSQLQEPLAARGYSMMEIIGMMKDQTKLPFFTLESFEWKGVTYTRATNDAVAGQSTAGA